MVKAKSSRFGSAALRRWNGATSFTKRFKTISEHKRSRQIRHSERKHRFRYTNANGSDFEKYPNKGDIDAVFATWDEFAKGATRAIQQAGRTEIKVYGIDLSDEDLQMIQQPNSPWVATTATDPAEVGRVQVRFAYQKLQGKNAKHLLT